MRTSEDPSSVWILINRIIIHTRGDSINARLKNTEQIKKSPEQVYWIFCQLFKLIWAKLLFLKPTFGNLFLIVSGLLKIPKLIFERDQRANAPDGKITLPKTKSS